MKEALTIQLGRVHRSIHKALRPLRVDPVVSFRPAYESASTGRLLRICPASRALPVISVLLEDDVAREDDQVSCELGLTELVWHDERDWELWRHRTRPLSRWRCVGTPDSSRPWVLVEPGLELDAQAIEEQTGLLSPQLHSIAGLPLSKRRGDGVRWFVPWANLLPLLGHVDCVVASDGPLAWDARRAGVPLVVVGERQYDRKAALSRLVPAALATKETFWLSLSRALTVGRIPAEWGTFSWVRASRRLTRAPRPSSVVARKLLKMRREPDAFWHDSRLAKWLTLK